ncbi:MAG: hypothetical protein ACLFNL_08245 [Bacteroidales bacterium]
MDFIDNIKTSRGNYYKVFWDKDNYGVEFSQNAYGPFHKAPAARDEDEALKNAKNEAENIERIG